MAVLSSNTRGSRSIDELQNKFEISQREDQIMRQRFEITKRNYWVAGTILFFIFLSAIAFIYYNQTRLKQQNEAMQAIIDAEEGERRRIAQDLHDSVSQTMSAAKLNLAVVRDELSFADEEQRSRYEKAITLVDNGFKEVRTISHNMMPWALHKTGLAKVVQQFLDNIRTPGLEVNFFTRGFESPFNESIEIILYRVLQECVHNVLKHAHASTISISLIRDEQSISLTVEDDGRGFDSSDPQIYSGMGLSNLRSRINYLKGKLEISSQPGRGALVSIYIPLT